MSYPQITLRRGSDHLVINGHPWVYSGAIARARNDVTPGEVVDVVNFKGRFVGRGYYNPNANIAVRMLTRADQVIDAAYFGSAFRRASDLRRQHPSLRGIDAFRLIHGESDGLPGLIVDSYAGFLVVQLHTAGMERCRALVIDALNSVIEPRGIYERSDVGTRRADGLKDRPTGHLSGEQPPDVIEFDENGVTLLVDVRRGQKTGFFIDQRENRTLVQRLADRRSVLDCFAYTGGFSAHALRGGARRVLSLDVVPEVARFGIENLQRNSAANSPFGYTVTDVFQFLDDAATRGPKFDMVILDPPSLLRKNRDIKRAAGVYIKLNRNALKLVRNGGVFVTASCSTRVAADDFLQIVRKAGAGAKVRMRILTFNQHPADHPVDPAFPEGQYLKCIAAAVERGS